MAIAGCKPVVCTAPMINPRLQTEVPMDDYMMFQDKATPDKEMQSRHISPQDEYDMLQSAALPKADLVDFVENGAMSLHWVRPDGIIQWVNREELHVLGYQWHEYVGRHIREFHVDQDVINDILTRLTNMETLTSYPARLWHKNGSMIHVEINSSMYCDSQGKFVHTRCFTRDVTGVKLAEAEAERAESELRERGIREQAQRFQHLSEQLLEERALNTKLLHQMIPAKVAEDLTAGRPVPPEAFECVTIFFSDIEGFTQIAASVEPLGVVQLLNQLYTVMDYCSSLLPVYKVETIGDAYMVVGGLTEPSSGHAAAVADFALLVREAVRVVTNPLNKDPIRLRMGLHSGPVIAGVVGNLMPRYCLFGDAVNTANRMESTGLAGRIQCSSAVADSLLAGEAHALELRGDVEVKGKGVMTTYWLVAAARYNVRSNAAAIEAVLAKVPGLLGQLPGVEPYKRLLHKMSSQSLINNVKSLQHHDLTNLPVKLELHADVCCGTSPQPESRERKRGRKKKPTLWRQGLDWVARYGRKREEAVTRTPTSTTTATTGTATTGMSRSPDATPRHLEPARVHFDFADWAFSRRIF